MNILVTGGAGYIGSHMCKCLAQRGYTPVTYDNFCTGNRWAVRWGPLAEGDVRDRAAVERALRMHRIDVVMHFAGSAYVGESMADPSKYFDNNVIGGVALLQAMEASGVRRLVFSSSCATYGIPPQLPITEASPQCPINPYGESKLMLERLVQWYTALREFQAVTLRYFNVAGTDPEGEIGEWHTPETHIIPNALLAAQPDGAPLTLNGDDYDTPDGTAVRDYIHVWDLVTAHAVALEKLCADGFTGSLNLGCGRGYSLREIIETVSAVVGRPCRFSVGPRRPGDPAQLIAATERARTALGWMPRYSSLHTQIATAWRWYEQCWRDGPPRI